MTVAILKEPEFESRVSLLPEAVAALIKKGISVVVESGAGVKAFALDTDYSKEGALIVTREALWERADIFLLIHQTDIPSSLEGKVLVGVFQPLYQTALIKEWNKRRLTVFSLDMLPRISRAQSMDVLSSQANIAGYKAVIIAASCYPHYFPMLMTAAGSIIPARVLILGAGVAGLQAIATARRLGALVSAFDTRPSALGEVMSLGARFIIVEGAEDNTKAGGYAVEQTNTYQQKQKAVIREHLQKSDVVITTAQIFGKKAPMLISKDMIEGMKPGSIIIDLAAATGGNTEVTKDNETIVFNQVTVIGNSNLSSTVPVDASKVYGNNILNFLVLIINADGLPVMDFKDEIINGCCITHLGEVVNEKVKALFAKEA